MLVSIKDQGAIMTLNDGKMEAIGFDKLKDAFPPTQRVIMTVAKYSQLILELQMVSDHPQQIIDLQ